MFSAQHSGTLVDWSLTPQGLVAQEPEEGAPELDHTYPSHGFASSLQPPVGSEEQELAGEALAEALSAGDIEGVQAALAAGASAIWPTARGPRSATSAVPPLSLAARGVRPYTILQLLLESAAVEDPVALQPALHAALQAWTIGYVDVKENAANARNQLCLLIQYGADVNAGMDHNGETALHTAGRAFAHHRDNRGRQDQVGAWAWQRSEAARLKFTLLLEARADPQVRSRTRHETPLELAGQQFRCFSLDHPPEVPMPGVPHPLSLERSLTKSP